jgi:hypothetical protein
MGIAVVQEGDHVPPQMTEHLAQERHHFILPDVVPEK